MLGPETIRDISNVAAYRAAEEGREPLVIWAQDDLRHIAFLGDYTPQGWRRATWGDLLGLKPRNVWSARDDEEATFMVDSSGWGAPDEPALTFPETWAYLRELAVRVDTDLTFGAAIRESGEFQIVMGVYVKDPSSEGNPAPSEEDVICHECYTVHDALEECDEDGLAEHTQRCPVCADPIDYCQGHGVIGDPAGNTILENHDRGDHRGCNPDGCDEAGATADQEGLPW